MSFAILVIDLSVCKFSLHFTSQKQLVEINSLCFHLPQVFHRYIFFSVLVNMSLCKSYMIFADYFPIKKIVSENLEWYILYINDLLIIGFVLMHVETSLYFFNMYVVLNWPINMLCIFYLKFCQSLWSLQLNWVIYKLSYGDDIWGSPRQVYQQWLKSCACIVTPHIFILMIPFCLHCFAIDKHNITKIFGRLELIMLD